MERRNFFKSTIGALVSLPLFGGAGRRGVRFSRESTNPGGLVTSLKPMRLRYYESMDGNPARLISDEPLKVTFSVPESMESPDIKEDKVGLGETTVYYVSVSGVTYADV